MIGLEQTQRGWELEWRDPDDFRMNYFFSETKVVFDGLAELSDLTWATAASLWHMRAQFKGHFDLVVETTGIAPTPDEIKQRFLGGVHYAPNYRVSGVDLREFLHKRSWEDDLGVLARFSLGNAIALYEGWVESVVTRFGGPPGDGGRLQFPTARSSAGVPTSGCEVTLARYSVTASQTMRAAFTRSLRDRKNNVPQLIDANLTCYRGFKEVRNAWAHRGGIADAVTVQAVNLARSLTPGQLRLKQAPLPDPAQIGSTATASLFHVIGFLQVVRRIVTTVESRLALTPTGEAAFLQRWRSAHPQQVPVPRDLSRRMRHYRNELTTGLSFPEPRALSRIHTLLLREGLVRLA